VQRKGARLVLTSRSADSRDADASNLFWYPLSIPGEVVDSQRGFTLSVETAGPVAVERAAARTDASADPGKASIAVVRRDLIGGALAVRNRRPGDRFRPIGVGGRRKLQDYFVDRKIARDRRDAVPIVVDANDRIVWVAGHRIDEAFRVTDPAQHVLLLRLRQA
jgi:tRNA(Ile)-lysidine synthase